MKTVLEMGSQCRLASEKGGVADPSSSAARSCSQYLPGNSP